VLPVSSGYPLTLRLVTTSSRILIYSFYITILLLSLYGINLTGNCLKTVAYHKFSKQLVANLFSQYYNKQTCSCQTNLNILNIFTFAYLLLPIATYHQSM